MSGEPCSKRKKTDESKHVFVEFLIDEKRLRLLKEAHGCILGGKSDMRVRMLKLIETNARISEEFSRASCTTKMYEIEDCNPPMGIVYAIGTIFKTGLFILGEFLSSDPGIPQDFHQQEALKKLLIFMTLDHSALLDSDESNLAIRLSQHLFCPLSVEKKYTIDDNYKPVNNKYSKVCPCKAGDRLNSHFGDTSYGWIDGWHGRTDIMINGLTVGLSDRKPGEEINIDGSAVSTSNSSTGEKSTNTTSLNEKDRQKILAQTIVSSFLQQKESSGHMKNSLVPGLGISQQSVIGYFYDAIEDVLLETPSLDLFAYKSLCYNTIVFIWLTLNYTIFCSGITESMKPFKAEFFNRVDDFLGNYRNDVTRYLPEKQVESNSDKGWAKYPNYENEPYGIEETGEMFGVKIVRIDNSMF